MIVWVQVGLLRNSLLFRSVKFLGSTFFENLLMCVYQYFTWTFTDKDFRLSGHPSERVLRRARFVFLNEGRFYMSGQKRIHFICFDAHALLSFRAIMYMFY